MIHPSYFELMELVNKDVQEGEEPVVRSRYSIVLGTAKRARQVIEARHKIEEIEKQKNPDSKELPRKEMEKKPLSVAVEELDAGDIHIVRPSAEAEPAEIEEEIVDEVVEFAEMEEEAPADGE